MVVLAVWRMQISREGVRRSLGGCDGRGVAPRLDLAKGDLSMRDKGPFRGCRGAALAVWQMQISREGGGVRSAGAMAEVWRRGWTGQRGTLPIG